MIYTIISIFVFPSIIAYMTLSLMEDKAKFFVGLLVAILVAGIIMFTTILSIMYVEEKTIENIHSGKYEVIRMYTIEQGDTVDTRFKLKKIEK